MKNEVVDGNRYKLLVVGHGRHGKDSFCEYVRDNYNYKFQSSSYAALHIFMWDWFKFNFPGKYATMEECYEDRVNNRKLWADLIWEYNSTNPARLARDIMRCNTNIYCGMRNLEEFMACRKANIFDFVIYVDASKRMPPEPSMQISSTLADIVCDNNGTLEQFHLNIQECMLNLLNTKRNWW